MDAAPTVESFPPHLTRAWLYKRHIVIIAVTAAGRDAVEAWGNLVADTKTNWPLDRPYLALYDVSAPDLAFTPHVRKQASRVAAINPALRGRYAILSQPSVGAHVLQLFMRVSLQPSQRNLERQLFFDRENALNWLRERLEPDLD